MKINLISFFIVLFLLINYSAATAADSEKTAGNKPAAVATTDNKSNLKTEFKKTKDTAKESMVRDVQDIKEQAPKDFQESKKELINKKDEIKEKTVKELKDIREGLQKPLKPAKSE